jgi:hypothetical protein
MFSNHDFELLFWLDEYERHLLEHQANWYVMPSIHNQMVRALLERIATERKVTAAYERTLIPLREALEIH